MRFPGFEGEWERYRISDLLEFFATNSLSWKQLNYEFGDILNLHYGLIHKGFSVHVDLNKHNLPYINAEYKPRAYSLCENGDIVFADASEDTNDIAKAVELYDCKERKVVAGLHTIHGRDKLGKTIVGFKGYVFASSTFRNQIRQLAQGTKVFSISQKNFNECFIGVPSKKEQDKIANFMRLIDERIQTQMKIIEELEKLIRGLQEQIFSQKLRFKDENGNEFAEWEEKKIGELFKVTRGKVLPMNLITEKCNKKMSYPVYSSQTKNNGLAGYYNEFLFENAITWTTDGANAGKVHYRKGKFYCTNVCGVLLNEDGYANICIAQIINSISKSYVSYVGNPKLMNNVMSEINILTPSLLEQQKIANFLSLINQKFDTERQLLSKYQNQKKFLLQNMFI